MRWTNASIRAAAPTLGLAAKHPPAFPSPAPTSAPWQRVTSPLLPCSLILRITRRWRPCAPGNGDSSMAGGMYARHTELHADATGEAAAVLPRDEPFHGLHVEA